MPGYNAGMAHKSDWLTRIIVLAILGMVAVVVVPTMLPSHGGARHSRAHSDAANLAKSIARARIDTGNTTAACLGDLTHLTSATSPAECGTVGLCSTGLPGYACWGGPYITTISNDPWNNPYEVWLNASTFQIMVHSSGKDGIAWTSDDISYNQ